VFDTSPPAPLGSSDFTALVEAVKTAVSEVIGQSAPQLFDQVQARAFLGLSATTWFRAKAADQIPAPVLVGGAEKWRRVDLEEWLKRLRPARRRKKRREGPDEPTT
jgi:predicted DNA-binding transcriptional regulator AlpA